MNPIHVPCNTCRFADVCAGRDVMVREAVFVWLDGGCADCAEYTADFYHGLEGVFA